MTFPTLPKRDEIGRRLGDDVEAARVLPGLAVAVLDDLAEDRVVADELPALVKGDELLLVLPRAVEIARDRVDHLEHRHVEELLLLFEMAQFQNDELVVVDVEPGGAVEVLAVPAVPGELRHGEGEPVGGDLELGRERRVGGRGPYLRGIGPEELVHVVVLGILFIGPVRPRDRVHEKTHLDLGRRWLLGGGIAHLGGHLGDDG